MGRHRQGRGPRDRDIPATGKAAAAIPGTAGDSAVNGAAGDAASRDAADLHVPVLLNEVVELFAPLAQGGAPFVVLDGTLGMAGHTSALLATYPSCRVLGLDRDTEALGLARERLAPFGDRVRTDHRRFASFPEALADPANRSLFGADVSGTPLLDGALIDIGVSSLQLDESVRGFSVHGDGPLDMRMDALSGEESAQDLVNGADERRLAEIIATCGEDPMAGRIAKAICRARAEAPITTTGRLADIVWNAYPKAWREKSRHHPATRTFQALRVVVNDELGELERFLDAVPEALRPGGILCVITFHSLEDRLVKRAMKRWASGCLCPPHVTVCRCGHKPEAEILTRKPLVATPGELASNPRASSAKLRACRFLERQPQSP